MLDKDARSALQLATHKEYRKGSFLISRERNNLPTQPTQVIGFNKGNSLLSQ